MKDIEHYKRAIAKGMDRGYWVGVLQMLGLSDDCGTKNPAKRWPRCCCNKKDQGLCSVFLYQCACAKLQAPLECLQGQSVLLA